MDLRATYNRIANDWVKDHSNDTWWVEGTEKFISFLQPGSSVVDVGCGAGVKSKFLASRGLNVIGVDFSEELIRIAKENTTQAKFIVGDIRKELCLSKNFDGVFAQAVLLHISKNEILKVLRNITSVLAPGKYFYLAVKEKRVGQPEEEIVTENDYGYSYQRFFSYYTTEEIVKYLHRIMFQVVYLNVTSTGKTNWIQLVGKKS